MEQNYSPGEVPQRGFFVGDLPPAAPAPAAPGPEAKQAPPKTGPNYKIEDGKLTCLICGRKGMPAESRFCSGCGVMFLGQSEAASEKAPEPAKVEARTPVGKVNCRKEPDGTLTCLVCGKGGTSAYASYCMHCRTTFLPQASDEYPYSRDKGSKPELKFDLESNGVSPHAITALIFSIFSFLMLFSPIGKMDNIREETFSVMVESHVWIYLAVCAILTFVVFVYVVLKDIRRSGLLKAGIAGETIKMALCISAVLGKGIHNEPKSVNWQTGQITYETSIAASLTIAGWFQIAMGMTAVILMFVILSKTKDLRERGKLKR